MIEISFKIHLIKIKSHIFLILFLQIINLKIDVKGESKIGSLDNIGHKPSGGDKKIFDDKEYLKNIDHPVPITPPSQVKISNSELF